MCVVLDVRFLIIYSATIENSHMEFIPNYQGIGEARTVHSTQEGVEML